jgi:uncharacterized membrane protein YheB (UPF0754 family)
MENVLLESINEIHEEIKSLTKAGSCGEYKDTKGIIDSVLKSSICRNLLILFWQRTSDACPLEASKQEEQENEFNDWLLCVDFDHLVQEQKRIDGFKYCMPDGINSKQEHEEYLKAIGYKKTKL